MTDDAKPVDNPPESAPDSWMKTRILDRFRFYQTRCNLCGSERTGPSYAHFFSFGGYELQCCDRCKHRVPSDIARSEYWDRIYREPDAGSPLWRYVDLAKFIDIILFKRLWFARVANLEDAFEGALGTKTRQEDWRKWMFNFLLDAVENPPKGYEKNISSEHAYKEATRLLSDTERALSSQRLETFVSCWHMAKHESFLMWKVYAGGRPDSVCMKTNLVRVRNSLNQDFKVGLVNYIDFRSKFPDVNWPFLYKRAAFLQESEVRIFIRKRDISAAGLNIEVDPAILINEVLISPDAPLWMIDNVHRLIQLSGHAITCTVSDLNEEPF